VDLGIDLDKNLLTSFIVDRNTTGYERSLLLGAKDQIDEGLSVLRLANHGQTVMSQGLSVGRRHSCH
jgi:hypothetical protein